MKRIQHENLADGKTSLSRYDLSVIQLYPLEPSAMNVLLYVIKYTAAVLTGVYGVYATLTDFREEKNGKKLL